MKFPHMSLHCKLGPFHSRIPSQPQLLRVVLSAKLLIHVFLFVLSDPLAQQVLHYKKHCDWLAKLMGKDPESFTSEELQVNCGFSQIVVAGSM